MKQTHLVMVLNTHIIEEICSFITFETIFTFETYYLAEYH